MFGTLIPAIIVFGAMLVGCVFALSMFNAQSKRLNATTPRPEQPAAGRDTRARQQADTPR